MDAPHDTASYIRQRQRALRRFGHMLRKWRESNEWTIYTSSQWGKAVGFSAPSADKISRIENALIKQPDMVTLFRFADVNLRIAKKEWGAIRSTKLKMLVASATPIVDDEKKLAWGPKEFWGALSGLDPIPAHLVVEDIPPLDLELTARLCRRWHQMFMDAVKNNKLKATVAVKKAVSHLPAHMRTQATEVLLMGAELSAAEMENQWFGEWLIEKALSSWIQNLKVDETP